MKSRIFTIALLCVFSMSFAQEAEKLSDIPAGYQFVKAGINFSTTKQGDVKTTNFSVLPVYGIFVAKNVSVALGVGYNNSKSEFNNTTTSENNGVTFIGLARQYKHISAPFYVFLQQDLSYSSSKDKISDINTKNFGIGISPGFNYFFSNHISADITYGRLGFDSSKPDGGTRANTFGLKADMFAMTFGLLYSW